MNRQERRALQRSTKKKIKKSAGSGVMLEGGPMNDWFVKVDAPALNPEWGKPHGGRYEPKGVNADGIKRAVWKADK